MTEVALTPSQKAQVVAVLCDLDPTRRGLPPELRRWKRHHVAQPITVYRLPNADAAPHLEKAIAKDVSPGGIGLLSKEPFTRGQRFVWPARFDDGGGKLFLCEVLTSRKSPSNVHAVGARFLDSADDPSGHTPIPVEWLIP